MAVRGTPIVFFRSEGTRYRSRLERADGVTIELDGGGYNKVGGAVGRVPHDLAHFVVEDALGLEQGLWGVIVAGGLFGHTAVVAGRQPPHAARQAQAVVDAAGDRLSQAEMLTRAVSDLARAERFRDVAGLERALGDRWWKPGLTADQLQAACIGLRTAADGWAALAPGGSLERVWRLPLPRR
ncbi:hypothetical protein [Patulibacter defluvii]|uniref:hypothetical protein n=1 Tax=Patulibacter defluvii TaxID=3095358 RepID=UPI002A75C61D|nr:hypothetical protein [Patulibacter sp. DM4]